MKEKLHGYRETAESAGRKAAGALPVIGVVLVLLATVVAGQALTGSWSDDFEDGNADGWQLNPGSAWSVSSSGASTGNQSLFGETDVDEVTTAEWDAGPVLDLSEDFTVTGTLKPVWVDTSNEQSHIRIGIGPNFNTEGENAVLVFNDFEGVTYLATHGGGGSLTASTETIQSSFADTWVNFRLDFDAETDTMNAKVWAVGSAEPQSPQISRTFSGDLSGQLKLQLGTTTATRQMYLDDVQIEGSRVESDPSLGIDTRNLYLHGATHDYMVYELRNESGNNVSYNVTENATVESLNTSLLTVNENNNTMTATSDKNKSGVVLVRAEYNGNVTYTNVTVAEPTVANLPIVPGIWRISAVIGDSTMFALLVATLLAVPAARYTSAFGGLAIGEMVLVVGWLGGWVGFGIAAVSVFVSLFIGLNLAANINYMGGRLGGGQ